MTRLLKQKNCLLEWNKVVVVDVRSFNKSYLRRYLLFNLIYIYVQRVYRQWVFEVETILLTWTFVKDTVARRREEFLRRKLIAPTSEKTFKCDHCDNNFKSENGLKIHIGKSHKKGVPSNITCQWSQVQETCSKISPTTHEVWPLWFVPPMSCEELERCPDRTSYDLHL